MKKTEQKLTQKEALAQQLLELSVDVTAEDRELLSQEKGFSKSTISNYLNGDVYDNDTAVTIIVFLQKRIVSRYKKIKKAV